MNTMECRLVVVRPPCIAGTPRANGHFPDADDPLERALIDGLFQLWTRLIEYDRIEVFVEVGVIAFIVFLIYRFLRGTRGARIFQGVGLVLLIASFLLIVFGGDNESFPRLKRLFGGFVNFAILALVIVFQPELRRAMVRLGEARLFRSHGVRIEPVIEEIVMAAAYLSTNKIGGLIAIEREDALSAVAEGGTRIDAAVSSDLLKTIFWPGSALHDMGVVIRAEKIVAAGVQFPLADSEEISQELGSRHRAAIGLSQESDCLVVVISEETGIVSLAENGRLKRKLSSEDLREALRQQMSQSGPALEGVRPKLGQATSRDAGPPDDSGSSDSPARPPLEPQETNKP